MAGGPGRLPARPLLAVGGVLAALGLLTASAVAVTWREIPATEHSRAELVRRVESATDADAAAVAALQELSDEVERLRVAALAGAGDDARVEQRLAVLSVAAGSTSLEGPGVQVVLDDGPPSRSEAGGPNLARVLDRDLQLAVNGLLAAGAEAVEVNGRRVTTVTAIRSAGDAILVGFRPLTRPYVVTAIGDPLTLESAFAGSPAGQELRTLALTYGMRFDTSTQDRVTVAGEAPAPLRYARPEEG